MERTPIGFIPPSPEDAGKISIATDDAEKKKEVITGPPGVVVEQAEHKEEVPAALPSTEGARRQEEPKKKLAEVAGLYKKLSEIKEKEPDGEMSGTYRAARLDWERALGDFVRNPDFSSVENNQSGKKELEEAIEKYKTLQEIEENAKTDTGHVYGERDITAMNEARSAVRGYFESHLEKADAQHQEEVAGRIEEVLSGPTPRPAREVPPTVDLPFQEDTVAPVEAPEERSNVVHLGEARRRLRSVEKPPVVVSSHSEKAVRPGPVRGERPEKIVKPPRGETAGTHPTDSGEIQRGPEFEEMSGRRFEPKVGDTVRVPTDTPGMFLETGWRVESIKRDSKKGGVDSIVVMKEEDGKKYKRIVSGADAWKFNATFAEKGHLKMFDSVRIPKSVANVEGGWTIVGYDPLTKTAEVKQYAIGLTEHVSIADLERINQAEAIQKEQHATPEELRKNKERGTTAADASHAPEVRVEEEKKITTPAEFISGKARAVFEKLGGQVRERVRGMYERAKFNTLDRAAVLYNNYFYDHHDERIRSLDDERRLIDREINAIREAMLRRSGADFEDVSHTRHALKNKERALIRGEADIRKLEARKKVAESRMKHERVKQGVFERRRRDILEKVSGRVSEAVRPHEMRMERVGGSIQKLETVVDSQQQKRARYQRELEQLEGQMKNAPRRERRILKTIHEEIRAALKELDTMIHGRKKDLVRLEKERARVSAKAQPWRETQLRFQGLVGKK